MIRAYSSHTDCRLNLPVYQEVMSCVSTILYVLLFLVPTVKGTSQTNGVNKEPAKKPTTRQSSTVTLVTRLTLPKSPLIEANSGGGKKFVLRSFSYSSHRDYKQLLDEVIVISGIIKAEVTVISRSRRLRLITLIESNNCFIIHC